MKFKSMASVTAMVLAATSTNAAEYICKVYCKSGSTEVAVNASSKSDAAEQIDPSPVANRICKEAGMGTSSRSKMSSKQCVHK